MPSFIIHEITANKLFDKLDLNELDKKRFLIANLLPDEKNVPLSDDLTIDERHKLIQKSKIETHFRTDTHYPLSYPDMDLFISKYEESIKSNVVTFGYFFHLYVDYYFYYYYLPSKIKFLDIKHNETKEKEDCEFILVKKENRVLNVPEFFSKVSNDGIYEEYNRLNRYLIREYSLDYDFNSLYELCDKLDVEVKETNPNGINVMKTLEYLIHDKTNLERLKILDLDSIKEFLNDVVEEFIRKYKYLLHNYLLSYHSIIVIKKEDKYLQYYDDNWKSYLFPNCKGSSYEDVESYITKHFKGSYEIEKKGILKSIKYSVSNKCFKHYHHTFYIVNLSEVDSDLTCKWMSAQELMNDVRIQEVNSDITQYVINDKYMY